MPYLSARIILESLCYALEQAFSSCICIVGDAETPEGFFIQAKKLVNEIEKVIAYFNLKPESLKYIKWYQEKMITAIKKANTWEEAHYGYTSLLLEDDLDLDIDDYTIAEFNKERPCDLFGPEACTPDCPYWNRGCNTY